jgi:DNA-binding IclR family transcriptional regulator
MSIPTGSPDGGRSVLGRAFRVLDCFASGAATSVSAIVLQTELPPATVHRILASLVEWGAVEHVSHGRYQLGARIWNLGVGAPQMRLLREIAQPHLVDLHLRTRGSVYLAIRDGADAIIADRITTVKRTTETKKMTRRSPLQATGVGRAILAFAPDAWDALQAGVHAGADPASSTAKLADVLAAIRAERAAITRNDGVPGRQSVASPLLNFDNVALGAIAAVFPSERIANPAGIVPAVIATAQTISREFAALG